MITSCPWPTDGPGRPWRATFPRTPGPATASVTWSGAPTWCSGARSTTGWPSLDVTMAQVGLAGELLARGPRAVADLARAIGITPQGAALAVGHLRKIGWVTESQAKGRGRSIMLEITDKGRDGYLEAARIVEQVDKALTGGMTAAERKGTLAGLKAVADEGPPR